MQRRATRLRADRRPMLIRALNCAEAFADVRRIRERLTALRDKR